MVTFESQARWNIQFSSLQIFTKEASRKVKYLFIFKEFIYGKFCNKCVWILTKRCVRVNFNFSFEAFIDECAGWRVRQFSIDAVEQPTQK